ncbi:hypothetical protein TL16_g12687 [Triparma laevis f. inornata]|uniref:ILEI/PANDER domain-containing protein n=1 Tax=Triparma laevis f. inornata TaxID=1714386 RepID=A0A9W7BU76_9STRA|nr:hypothetical protein TL16_g12687 [Triparma laevis f. inornata]
MIDFNIDVDKREGQGEVGGANPPSTSSTRHERTVGHPADDPSGFRDAPGAPPGDLRSEGAGTEPDMVGATPSPTSFTRHERAVGHMADNFSGFRDAAGVSPSDLRSEGAGTEPDMVGATPFPTSSTRHFRASTDVPSGFLDTPGAPPSDLRSGTEPDKVGMTPSPTSFTRHERAVGRLADNPSGFRDAPGAPPSDLRSGTEPGMVGADDLSGFRARATHKFFNTCHLYTLIIFLLLQFAQASQVPQIPQDQAVLASNSSFPVTSFIALSELGEEQMQRKTTYTYTLLTRDSFGDGWNGGVLDITSPSGQVITSNGPTSGCEWSPCQRTESISFSNCGTYTAHIPYTSGWPSERSWVIKTSGGTQVASGSTNSEDSFSVPCDDEESPPASGCDGEDPETYTIITRDTYGDAWNGGVLRVRDFNTDAVIATSYGPSNGCQWGSSSSSSSSCSCSSSSSSSSSCQRTETFPLCCGHYSAAQSGSSWNSEIIWIIQDSSGSEVASATSTTSDTFEIPCSPPTAPAPPASAVGNAVIFRVTSKGWYDRGQTYAQFYVDDELVHSGSNGFNLVTLTTGTGEQVGDASNPHHSWDFRGCTTGLPIMDSGPAIVDFSSATSIFIEVDSILNLYEVEARDADGNRIAPTSATLSSTHSWNYPASECIDQVTNSGMSNMCHTLYPDPAGDPWLRIDYPAGALANLNSIVIYNRLDCCGSRINGGTVTVAQGSPTSSASAKSSDTSLWTSATFSGSQNVYTLFPVPESLLRATPMNGPICSADGLSLDGNNDYVDIDDWEWGGTTSIEAYVKYNSFNSYSKIFDFSNGAGSDNVILLNRATTSEIGWDVYQGSTAKYLTTSNWDSSTWTHVVVTVSGTTMKVYKNGALAGTKTDGHEPNVLTRAQHWLGRSAWSFNGYFDGTIAYVKMWHGVELQQSDVTALYAPHNTAHHFWDFRGCTTGGTVTDSIAGDLVATPVNGPVCGADGLRLDGSNDYAVIDDWEWGGTTSIEVYVKYESFNGHNRVFDFSNGGVSERILLDHATPTIIWQIHNGNSYSFDRLEEGTFDSSTWTHVVVTVSGTTMKIYKNGALAGIKTDGHEPNVLTRIDHFIGANDYNGMGNYMDGTIAYLKMWHGVELQQSDVTELYAHRQTSTPPQRGFAVTAIATGLNMYTNPSSNSQALYDAINSVPTNTIVCASVHDTPRGITSFGFAGLHMIGGQTTSFPTWRQSYILCGRKGDTSPIVELGPESSPLETTLSICDNGSTLTISESCSSAYADQFDHFWDFRGCSGSGIIDAVNGSSLTATFQNGASCGNNGIKLDGNNDYVDIDDWKWGGTTSFEVYVKYDSFNSNSRVFDFGSGAPNNNVYLSNGGASSTIGWIVAQGSGKQGVKCADEGQTCACTGLVWYGYGSLWASPKQSTGTISCSNSVFGDPYQGQSKDCYCLNGSFGDSNFDSSTWTHVVITISGTTMKVYKNGALAGTKTDGHEPNVLTRTQHWLGRSAWSSDGYFHGTIGYLKVWHNVALTGTDISTLYDNRNSSASQE